MKPWNGKCEMSELWYAAAGTKDYKEFKELNMEKVIFNGKEYEVVSRSGEDVLIMTDNGVRFVAGNVLGKAKKLEPKAETKKVEKSEPVETKTVKKKALPKKNA